MSIVLVLAFVLVPLVLTAALTPVALALFPRFRSHESKPQSSQVAFATRTSSRLPLVGGPILALAIAMGVLFHPDAPLWPLAAIAGFFAFGLIDDLAKTIRGRGIGEGLYFAVIVLLSIAAALLILGRDFHDLGTLTPFALATHLGTDADVTLGVWYVVLILGTALAAGFSDGMDGLTAGAATILMAGLWLAAGPVTGAWAGLTAAGAGGALVWNLPSRWSPSARDRPRRARAYIGDSGALMLGATMAIAAIVAGYDLLWPLIAAPLLLEGFSSLVQFKILVPSFAVWSIPATPMAIPSRISAFRFRCWPFRSTTTGSSSDSTDDRSSSCSGSRRFWQPRPESSPFTYPPPPPWPSRSAAPSVWRFG